MRKVPVPAHRYTPLKENWMKIYSPIVENLQLQVRFNLKTRNVEIKVSVIFIALWYHVLWGYGGSELSFIDVLKLFCHRPAKKLRILVQSQKQLIL